jgi:hypothetical protein
MDGDVIRWASMQQKSWLFVLHQIDGIQSNIYRIQLLI